MAVAADHSSSPTALTPARPSHGLLERAPFFDLLRRAIGRADGLGGELALLVMALDPFILADPSDAWQMREEVSVVTASRLVGFLHYSAVAARITGDEFLVLAEGVRGVEEAVELGERIVAVTRWPDRRLFGDRPATASVGVALHEAHSSGEQLLIKADIAMYLARRQGGNQVQVFEEWMRDAASGPPDDTVR